MFIDNLDWIHIEPTAKCNAACPSCLRNYYSQPLDKSVIDPLDFNINLIKKINWGDPYRIMLQGNYGDIIMHKNALDFCEASRNNWPDAETVLYTNAGARDKQFYREVAKLGCTIEFGIDGIDQETNVKYRINTRYEKIIENARAFIEAGGTAIWAFTEFGFNKHQTEQVKELAKEMGFKYCVIRPSLREPITPVLNEELKLIDVITAPYLDPDEIDLKAYGSQVSRAAKLNKISNGKLVRLDNTVKLQPDNTVVCDSVVMKLIYIDAHANVMPCNYFGDPEKWNNICEYFGENSADYNLNNNDLKTIVTLGLWDKLTESFETGNTINFCVGFCSKKIGPDLAHMHDVKARKEIK